MGKISTYSVLSTPTVNDKLIGTDVTTNNETKNFLIGDLLSLVIGGNIGKQLGGGIVVSEWDENGVHKALIASLTDIGSSIQWTVPAKHNILIGPTAQSFPNGLTNTNAIIAQTGAAAANTYAAGAARLHNGGGFSDWYLPAQWELNICYNAAAIVNKVLGSLNGFSSSTYWSSTEISATTASIQYFNDGSQINNNKSAGSFVRAVRIHNI